MSKEALCIRGREKPLVGRWVIVEHDGGHRSSADARPSAPRSRDFCGKQRCTATS
jgi:hypothetical protein